MRRFFLGESEACWSVFSGEQKTEQPWSVFLESRKQRRAGVIFPGAENLQQQFFIAAEQPDLYADWVRSSSICF